MIYYASGETEDPMLDYLVETGIPLLTSFAYIKAIPHKVKYLADRLRPQGRKLNHMLDSGAFSVWNKGGSIDIDYLCNTANKLQDEYGDCFNWTFIALDVIPGKKGHPITPADIASACKGSAENYALMRRKVNGYVKPVFHVGDPDWLIDEYADAPYVGMGFSQSIAERDRVLWAYRNVQKFAGKKLHGLAATGWRMLVCAPWHSVDSAAALHLARNGKLGMLTPKGGIQIVAVSKDSGERKRYNAHIDSLPKIYRDQMLDRFDARGFTLEDLQTSHVKRWQWNVGNYHTSCQMAEGWYAQHSDIRQGHKGFFDA